MSPSLQTMGFFMSDINFCNTKEQLNHLGEVVTGKVDGSPSGADIDTSTLPYTGQVRRTLPALEAEYEQSITNKEAEADAAILNKQNEADAAIDAYRLLSKGTYSAGITLEDKFQYVTYNGEAYFATNPPYTTTSTTPDADVNLYIGNYVSPANISNYSKVTYKDSGATSAFQNMITGSPIEARVGDIAEVSGLNYLIKTASQASIDGDVILEACNVTLSNGLVAILQHKGTVTSTDIRANTSDATANLIQITNAILEDLNGAGSFEFSSDVEIDSVVGGSCILEFNSISRPLKIDSGPYWIKFKNALRGGNHTGGRFSVGTDRTIGNLNLDGQVYSVTEAQSLSNIPDPSAPAYSNGIQRGFYHKTEDNLKVDGTLKVKGFRHFGFDVTGDSTPTKSYNVVINNLEISDCFGYNYIMAALVRYDSVKINTLKCEATASAWLNRPETGTPIKADISGFDVEPAKTNSDTMSSLNIGSIEVTGCVMNGFSDESYNHAQQVNITNVVGRNPGAVDSGFGLSMVGTEANVTNVNLEPSGKFEIEEKSTTDSIVNPRTVNFSNVHIEKQGYSGNLLLDADFSSLNPWIERGSQTNELTEDGEFGKYRLHMVTNSSGSTVGRRQDVPCIADEVYVYGVHAESSGLNNSGNPSVVAVSISFYDSGDTLLSSKSIRLVDLGLSVKGKTIGTATAPAGSSYIRFNISAEGSSSANADAYIDAAFLYRGYGFDRYTPSLKKSQSLVVDWNVDSLPSGNSDTVVREYIGARVGQVLTVTPKTASVGIILYGYVTADDSVTIVATNASGSTLDLPQDEYYVIVN